MKDTTYIEISGEDIARPSDRPDKTNWKIELIKKGLGLLQHASPKKSAEIIWHYFTMPGRTKFSQPQMELLEKAEMIESSYKGDTIQAYRWGTEGPKVLLCHGWRSKIADFRRMIEAFLEEGYVVEGIDMRAHGRSEGKHTALPEYRDIIKNHLVKNGPYDVVVGYSLGGIASGMVISEVSSVLHPTHYFVLAGPPYVRYFFKDIVDEVGCNESVYNAMCDLVEENYHQSIDYFDLRSKGRSLAHINTHLAYCEDDQMIPFEKGQELETMWPHAAFVHAKGLGHYKIIANGSMIEYIMNTIKKHEK
ncbi:MAG: alpha/beta hydrolase [Cyclobacteriaceae bacterium]